MSSTLRADSWSRCAPRILLNADIKPTTPEVSSSAYEQGHVMEADRIRRYDMDRHHRAAGVVRAQRDQQPVDWLRVVCTATLRKGSHERPVVQ